MVFYLNNSLPLFLRFYKIDFEICYKSVVTVFILVALIVILVIASALTGNKMVGPIYRAIASILQGIDMDSVMSYVVYDNQQIFDDDLNTNEIKALLEFNNEYGIEYIITPQVKTINANGKSKLALD